MKKILVNIAFVSLTWNMMAQSGASRTDAITVQPLGLCNYSDYTTSGTEMWFRFIAQSEHVAIELQSEKFGNNLGHIHNLKLYHGNETTELTQDELPFNSESKKLKINLNAGNLIVGGEYFLRADRKAHIDHCNKPWCTDNNSMNPAQISLCVQNVSLYIPNDFEGEPASASFGYEENRGQVADLDGHIVNELLFYTKNSTPQVYLGNHFSSFVWSKIDTDSLTQDTIHRIDFILTGGYLDENVLKSEELAGYNNYYLAPNPKGILENKSYERIIRKNIYNGIDHHFYSDADGLKMYFVVNSGGNHQDIKFKFDGGATTELTSTGGLKVKSAIGELSFKKALVYNINPNGNNVPMPASGTIVNLGNNEYSISVENYPLNRPLIIELQQEEHNRAADDIEWSTYLGGSGGDLVYEVTGDSQKNFYICGNTQGAGFPVNGGLNTNINFSGFNDVFAGKFNSNYSKLWMLYLGGDNTDYSFGIDHDEVTGAIYLTGNVGGTSSNISPLPFASNPASYYDPLGGSKRQFLARFDGNGVKKWLTFLPQIAADGIKVQVDNLGSVYCVGTTSLPNNNTPVYSCSSLPNGDLPICRPFATSFIQNHHNGGPVSDPNDLFIMKFNSDLKLEWSTYFGGSGNDMITDIEIDNAGPYLYVVGITKSPTCTTCYPDNTSSDFPVKDLGGYFQTTSSGMEGFVVRFTLNGELNWSTLYGGEGDDYISDATLEPGHNFIISGTTSTNYYHNIQGQASNNGGFPNKNLAGGFYQNAFGGGGTDGFIAQFRIATPLVWSSYIGGAGKENFSFRSFKVDLNEERQLFLLGLTQSGSNDISGTIGTLTNPYFYNKGIHSDYVSNGIGHEDNFVMGFDQNRIKTWCSYFGGKDPNPAISSYGEIPSVIYCLKERVYIGGITWSMDDFPLNCPNTFNPYCQSSISGWPNTDGNDAYLAQLKIGAGYAGLNENIYTVNQAGLELYPNPNQGSFTLEWSAQGGEAQTIRISNQLGQVIKTIEVSAKTGQQSLEIDLSSWSNGIYIVTLVDTEQIKSTKIIKF